MDGIAQARDFLLGRTNETGYSRGFTAFATVYLDDVPEPFCGNFTVRPSCHECLVRPVSISIHTLDDFQSKATRIRWEFRSLRRDNHVQFAPTISYPLS